MRTDFERSDFAFLFARVLFLRFLKIFEIEKDLHSNYILCYRGLGME